MPALLLILPVLAFDLWLLATTGKKLFHKWARPGAWPRLAAAGAAGVALGVGLAFFVKYKWGPAMRVSGFPVPAAFSHLQDGRWDDSLPPAPLRWAALAVNLLSGLAAPALPFKFAQFLRSVKAELRR
ncbi:MAG: hypothetical protein ABSA47_20050 [Verrucomicrobiota bacterium]|jgi:hypothetical protein